MNNVATETAIDAEFTEERSLVRTESQPLSVLPAEMSPEVFQASIQRKEQMRGMLKDYVKRNMVAEHHFSTKLGTMTLPKPMLLQEGARNICSLFNLFFGEPQLVETYLEGGHYRVRSHIKLFNAEGRQIASGDAVCSTLEPKYAYRKGDRICPECNHASAIIKGKSQYGGGWVCYGNKGGCGAKFDDNDERITSQQLGRVDNPDKAELENTVLKMSIKRAKVAAVCDVAMVSEIFAPEGPDDDVGPVPQNSKPQSTNKQHPHVDPQAPIDEKAAVDQLPEPVANAVKISTQLQKDYGVDFESLAMQFLPEGKAKFSELSEAEALDAMPGLSDLLTSKIKEAKERVKGS